MELIGQVVPGDGTWARFRWINIVIAMRSRGICGLERCAALAKICRGVDYVGSEFFTERTRMENTVEREFYRFIPGPFQYSAGVIAKPGFAMQRMRFMQPVPLVEGFRRIEAFMRAVALPLTAFGACELRSPAPFTDAGFTAFNREYVGTLERWGIFHNEENPVARSNVCPELHKPDSPSFYAFSVAVPTPDAPPTFVIAGSGESQEGHGTYKERTVRYGDTSPDGMRDKIAHVMATMESRMAAAGVSWANTTATQVYTVFDIHPHVADGIVAKGGARHGIDWHYCRPPVVGLDYEMDTRAVLTELVLPA